MWLTPYVCNRVLEFHQDTKRHFFPASLVTRSDLVVSVLTNRQEVNRKTRQLLDNALRDQREDFHLPLPEHGINPALNKGSLGSGGAARARDSFSEEAQRTGLFWCPPWWSVFHHLPSAAYREY